MVQAIVFFFFGRCAYATRSVPCHNRFHYLSMRARKAQQPPFGDNFVEYSLNIRSFLSTGPCTQLAGDFGPVAVDDTPMSCYYLQGYLIMN